MTKIYQSSKTQTSYSWQYFNPSDKNCQGVWLPVGWWYYLLEAMKKKEILARLNKSFFGGLIVFVLVLSFLLTPMLKLGFGKSQRLGLVSKAQAISIYQIPKYFVRIKIKKITPSPPGLEVKVIKEEENHDALKITNNTNQNVYLTDYHSYSNKDQYLITPKKGIFVLSGGEWVRSGIDTNKPPKTFFLIYGRGIGLYSPPEYQKYYHEENPSVIIPWEVLGRVEQVPLSIQGVYFYELNPNYEATEEKPTSLPVYPGLLPFFIITLAIFLISVIGIVVGFLKKSLIIKIIFSGIVVICLFLLLMLLLGVRLPAVWVDSEVLIGKLLKRM